jgi:type III secretion system low calcium response chaperone LcrH/SycD
MAVSERNGASPAPAAANPEAKLLMALQKWADGKATLKEVRGYSDEELYAVAKIAYFFYYQGRIDEARTLFQGLYAVNPGDPYFAKALGVIELAAKNPQGALQAYDVAIKLSPQDPAAYAGRAEVRQVLGQADKALDDWRRVLQIAPEGDPLRGKAEALLHLPRVAPRRQIG